VSKKVTFKANKTPDYLVKVLDKIAAPQCRDEYPCGMAPWELPGRDYNGKGHHRTPKKIRNPERYAVAVTEVQELLEHGSITFSWDKFTEPYYARQYINKLVSEGFIEHRAGIQGERSPRLISHIRNKTTSNLIEEIKLKDGQELFVDLNDFYSKHIFYNCALPVMVKSWHGRIYCKGRNGYLNIPSEDRKFITVDGVGYVEIDIRSAHLTALMGMNGWDLSPADPYQHNELSRFDRELIKAAFNVLVGKTAYGKDRSRANSWYSHSNYRELIMPGSPHFREVEDTLYDVYPFLRNLPEGTWNTLCEKEANVIVGLVRSAARSGVVALSTHDGIMVPEPLELTTIELLRSRYLKEFGIVPEYKVIRPDQKEGDETISISPNTICLEEGEEGEHCVGGTDRLSSPCNHSKLLCLECGTEFTPKSMGRTPKFCCDQHRKNHNKKKVQ
jgi:hypothetical protein